MHNTIQGMDARARLGFHPIGATEGSSSPIDVVDIFTGPTQDVSKLGIYQPGAGTMSDRSYTEAELLCCVAIACCAGGIIFGGH